ncbi:MAG: aminotransferase class I/II-fold pyridoxal phosphate-dependent enzyme [Myxococcota bacterium]|nr:aminotransferase class I/II-fold pyridoxal phosphate-dependent enzyme [Myxococcota bacterium]
MFRSAPNALNPLALELNGQLEEKAPEVLAMLSEYGRRLYFPKGILSQSAEAKEKAHRFNATIGIATQDGGPMYLPSVHRQLADVETADAYPYAPVPGRPGLRAHWRDKIVTENPGLAGKSFGLPVVTAAITHGLALASELFVDEGDFVLLPDKLWGNYRLNFEVHAGAEIGTFPFYSEGAFNCEGFDRALAEASEGRDKVIVLLNFPNNPTGYMPTEVEAESIVASLLARAKAGTQLVVISDDAYFGLFYHIGGPSSTQSLFARLTGLHPNLLAVKLDGATKELFVWGLRCGFITFGPGRPETAEAVCAALEAKVKGAIRGGVSSVGQLSQSLVEHALASPSIEAERAEKNAELRKRAERVAEVAGQPAYAESWNVYPFNSGYFMCVAVKGVDAEKLRLHLLEEYGVGLISTSPTDIRVAFSCLEVDEIEPLFECLHRAVQELV